jgi:hypothetical protein
MADGSGVHRATDALLKAYEERNSERFTALLGYSPLLCKDAPPLPGMGIQRRPFLLVHQWHNLSGKTSRYLGRENENMSTMRSISLGDERLRICFRKVIG